MCSTVPNLLIRDAPVSCVSLGQWFYWWSVLETAPYMFYILINEITEKSNKLSDILCDIFYRQENRPYSGWESHVRLENKKMMKKNLQENEPRQRPESATFTATQPRNNWDNIIKSKNVSKTFELNTNLISTIYILCLFLEVIYLPHQCSSYPLTNLSIRVNQVFQLFANGWRLLQPVTCL